jgi:hypothetical protein
MKKFSGVFIGMILFWNCNLKADEGMWLLPLIQKLNIDTMHSLGLKLTAEQIYSINNGSLKDAIVLFNGGCTGEIVSESGLLLTNHHCGFDAIQDHSTLEHNYLKDGFWAKDYREELPNRDLTVTFLVRIEDVSEKIMAALSDTMSEGTRNDRISTMSDSISATAIFNTDYNASVESLFGGNNFYLFVYEDYNDVRLVGAPPVSIGKFGFDSDNWMWPRHTGDFSVFRVYSSPKGKPAAYDKNNVPLKPKYSLPISLKGVHKNDYAMVLGYPGSTQRYMTSYEIKEMMEITNPNRIKIRGLRQDILMKDMLADEKVNIEYASKYFRSSNYWKYSIGQNEGLKRLNIVEKKIRQEADFTKWVNADQKRKAKYGEALDLIKNAVEGRAIYEHTLEYTYETFFSSAEIIAFANKATFLYMNMLRYPDNQGLIDSLTRILKAKWDDFYQEYNAATDRKVVPAMIKLYYENVHRDLQPTLFSEIQSKFKNDFDAYAEDMFDKSIFADPEKMQNFADHPSMKVLKKDPAFRAVQSALETYRRVYLKVASFDEDYEKGSRLYIAGLQEMNPDKIFYPDGNLTMRLTYGTVEDYFPRDAVHYDYRTTLTGVMEKENPDNHEFKVPEKLKQLHRDKDYGPYGEDGVMPTCFLTTNDITGGNSGSPVIDGEGNLLGLAFDGNWEAMSSNIVFEPALQRCICVDIRYVLFIIDKFAGATNLINEMKFIR